MKNTVKKPPEYIRCALEVLAMPEIRAHDDFTALKKGLPVLAAKMFAAGHRVTPDVLTDFAHQGAAAVKEKAEGFSVHHLRTYDSVCNHFPKTAVAKEVIKDLATADNDTLWRAVYTYGCLDAFKALETRNADPRDMGKDLYYRCARSGHVEIFSYLLNKIETSYEIDQEALSRAAMAGQLGILHAYQKGRTDIKNVGGEALRLAAGEGHLDMVSYLVDQGVRMDVDNGAPLIAAVSGGHLDVIKYLQGKGADLHQNNEEPLRQAAMSNRFEVVKYLVEKGADIHADGGSAVSNPDMTLGLQIIDYLSEKGADISWMNPHGHQKISAYREWKRISSGTPPINFEKLDPHLFQGAGVQKCYKVLSEGLEKEGYAGTHSAKIAFQAAVLFGDDQIALRYLEKFGTAGKQPLHDVIYMIDFPKGDKLDAIEWDAWRGAIMAHGPKMAQFFKFADKVSPVRSACGKNWSYYETLDAVAAHGYAKADEHPELAALFMRLAMDEDDFEDALSLTKAFNCKARKTDIPDISFDLPNGHKYMRLPQGDVRGLVLGKFTDCCQSLNGAGDTCARHGFISNDSGFYVVLDKKGEIIGQSWAWLSHDNTMVLDSLETLGQRIDAREWTDIVQTLAKEVEKSAPNISGLHVGQGGKTPKMNFGEHSVKPKGYLGYRDSHTQYRVWKRKV